MILSIGEILTDINNTSSNEYACFAGGAPFNVAVNAKRAGATTGFIGRVGNDTMGRFLLNESKKAGLDFLDIQTDSVKNTTLAFVTLTDGERDFSFYRNGTADYFIDTKSIDFNRYKNLNIVNIGSLMLSTKQGVKTAKTLFKAVKKTNALIAFDINLRMGLFSDFSLAKKAYTPFIKKADIIKFSDDEFELFTSTREVNVGIKNLGLENKLVLVTFGAKGSVFSYNGMMKTIPTIPVKPIDTTGAGDAFFGTFLAEIDGKNLTDDTLTFAMEKASKAGSDATQFKGAVIL